MPGQRLLSERVASEWLPPQTLITRLGSVIKMVGEACIGTSGSLAAIWCRKELEGEILVELAMLLHQFL